MDIVILEIFISISIVGTFEFDDQRLIPRIKVIPVEYDYRRN